MAKRQEIENALFDDLIEAMEENKRNATCGVVTHGEVIEWLKRQKNICSNL